MPVAIDIRDVSFSYEGLDGSPRNVIMHDVNFSVSGGQTVAIIGPSGCGKTSLLNMLAGLQSPTEGGIFFDGLSRRPRVGFMFQESVFLPWRNTLENLTLGLEAAGGDRDHNTATASELLKRIGLSFAEKLRPHQCSGGMKRKLSLARTLAISPDVVLLDEPFSNLDSISRDEMELLIYMHVKERGTTTVMVTHQIDEAMALADSIVVVGGRPMQIDHSIPLNDLSPYRSPMERRSCPEFAKVQQKVWTILRLLGSANVEE